jgi:hypothetical protein
MTTQQHILCERASCFKTSLSLYLGNDDAQAAELQVAHHVVFNEIILIRLLPCLRANISLALLG